MNKKQPGSARLASSATHHLVQQSTILDRRYVKRPQASAAGKYDAATKPRHSIESAAAPSRLVNLNLHAAEIAELPPAEYDQYQPDTIDAASDAATYDAAEYYTEDPASAMLAEAEYYQPDDPTLTPETDTLATNDSETNLPATSTNYLKQSQPANNSDHYMESSTDTSQDSALSMYALEEMKRSMMNDLAMSKNLSVNVPDSSIDYTTQAYSDQSSPMNTLQDNTPEPATDSSDTPIDAISRATSDALASIRIATDSANVSEQMASLKAFASSIKSDPNAPEMAELGNTIEKFANVAMKSTLAKEEAEHAVAANVTRSAQIQHSASRINRSPVSAARASSMTSRSAMSPSRTTKSLNRTSPASAARSRSAAARPASPKRSYAKEPSNQVLEQALRSVATMEDREVSSQNNRSKSSRRRTRQKGGATRFAMAFGCAAACIAAVVFFVGSNIPDISVQVAAMQTGIEAAYPSYVPRDYSLSDISSENGRLAMKFDGPDSAYFTLVEEKSSWDSSALQRNYVEATWGEDYSTTHEQGITIYISGSNAAWVNGGILYKIDASGNNLTKKQLRNIVTSM